jgi:hypothetical protein
MRLPLVPRNRKHCQPLNPHNPKPRTRHPRFEASRRTYGSLWSSLLASLEGSANATAAAGSAEPGPAAARQLPLVNVVGSGELRDLSLPERLAGAVRVYRDLPYGEYFDTLCR